ncbi:hypothetical protein EV356DRAFT_508955 [Viridothelium virens]|uniref:Uncharacterized protein n=1 Tax=Viridothelium virens TaxID=1048519 RepID=A0A6A6GXV4_VIRVR|nr:hypothetical protein EV356DRAFT_508955 [Viridothelium virens]
MRQGTCEASKGVRLLIHSLSLRLYPYGREFKQFDSGGLADKAWCCVSFVILAGLMRKGTRPCNKSQTPPCYQ